MGTATITFDGTNAPTSAMGPADGDAPIQASDVVPGIQAAGDVAWHTLLRVTPLANLAALRAITTPADGLTRYVLGYGLYTFKTTHGLLVTVEPWAVAATDATPGRWVHENAKERVPGYRTIPLNDPFAISNVIAWSASNQLLNDVLAATVSRYASSSGFATVHTAADEARQLYFSLDKYLVNGARITSAQLSVSPPFHGALPALMPRFTLVRFPTDPWDSPLTNLVSGGYFSDSSHGSLATYEVVHKFGGTVDQNHDIDLAEYSYLLIVANEGGANAALGLAVGALELVMSP